MSDAISAAPAVREVDYRQFDERSNSEAREKPAVEYSHLMGDERISPKECWKHQEGGHGEIEPEHLGQRDRTADYIPMILHPAERDASGEQQKKGEQQVLIFHEIKIECGSRARILPLAETRRVPHDAAAIAYGGR